MKEKIGRNDPCPCGSGKKFKKCCERKMIGKRFMVQKTEQTSSPGINKATGLTSLFQNTIADTTMKPISERQISVTKGKPQKTDLPESDQPAPTEEAPPSTPTPKQDITPKKSPKEKELPPQEETPEEPLDAPPEKEDTEKG